MWRLRIGLPELGHRKLNKTPDPGRFRVFCGGYFFP